MAQFLFALCRCSWKFRRQLAQSASARHGSPFQTVETARPLWSVRTWSTLGLDLEPRSGSVWGPAGHRSPGAGPSGLPCKKPGMGISREDRRPLSPSSKPGGLPLSPQCFTPGSSPAGGHISSLILHTFSVSVSFFPFSAGRRTLRAEGGRRRIYGF